MPSPACLLRATLVLTLIAAPLAAQQPDDVEVRARPASEVLLPSTLRAAAVVLSPNDALLSAEVAAPVAKLLADVGATVSRGDVLLELDCTDLRLALAQAEAQVAAARARGDLAEQRRERGEQLAGKNFVSADELLALRTGAQSARADTRVVEAQRAIAARQVDKCRITAPFDAVVMERHAQVGALAAIGSPLLRLIDVSAAEVEARVPDAEAAGLEKATSLQFESVDQRYPLRLLRISDVVEPATRSRIVRLGFVDQAATAGSSGTLHWQRAGGRLPAGLLVQRDGVLGVFVADQGVARFVPVAGAQAGRPADVDRAPGALLVTEGQQGLQHGTPLRLQVE